MKFPRASEFIDNCHNQLITSNSTKELYTLIVKNENIKYDGDYFGPSENASVRELNEVCHIQTVECRGFSDLIDEIYGALGKFSLQLAVVGIVNITNLNEVTFKIHKYGIYIKDIYEFNGLQFLGCWTKDRCLGKKQIVAYTLRMATYPETGMSISDMVPLEVIEQPVVSVFNSDFCKWREKYHMGGDFIIYSDVYWVEPKNNNIITFSKEQSYNIIQAMQMRR